MGSPHHSPDQRATRQETQLRATEAEQPPSGSVARQRRRSLGSVERQRLVSPSSTARQRQGSSHERDTRDGSVTAVQELERTRRAHQCAGDTTLRRRKRLLLEQRQLEAAERAEQEETVATTRAKGVINRTVRARESVAAATPPSPARRQSVNSRSERPGDAAFLDGSVTFMASSARVEFSIKLGAAVIAKVSALLTSVRKTSLYPPEYLSVTQARSTMDNSSWQGQLRAAPTLDLATT